MKGLLLFVSRDAYCNAASLFSMLVSIIEFIHENMYIYLFTYISICFALYMSVTLCQREHMIFPVSVNVKLILLSQT